MPSPRIFTHVVSFVELSIALVALLAAVPALSAPSAQQRHLTEAQIAEIEQRFEEIRERLNLTDEQRTAMEPILRRSFAERIGILEKYGVSRNGGERPGFRQLRAMRKELEAAREQTERELSAVLDRGQMAEYRAIQDENRQAVRDRIRERR